MVKVFEPLPAEREGKAVSYYSSGLIIHREAGHLHLPRSCPPATWGPPDVGGEGAEGMGTGSRQRLSHRQQIKDVNRTVTQTSHTIRASAGAPAGLIHTRKMDNHLLGQVYGGHHEETKNLYCTLNKDAQVAG